MTLTLTPEDVNAINVQVVAIVSQYLQIGYDDSKAGSAAIVLDPAVIPALSIVGATLPTYKRIPAGLGAGVRL